MSAASTLGTAWIAIAPSLKGFQSKIAKATEEAARKASAGFKEKFSQSVSGVGKIAKASLVAGLGAASGILAKGFARATGIENANAAFKALGMSAEQSAAMMKASLNAVKGTAFGLNDAAQAAAKLGASISDAGEMEKTLKNVAAAAALSGADFGHLGSIFAEMAGKGKIMATDLMQLQNNGVPVFSFLQRSMGKTREEINKMVSEGKLSFTEFNQALSGVLGKAAVDAANTTTGAFMNFGAALSRLGASAIAPLLPVIKDVLKLFIDLADAASKRLSPVFEHIGSALSNLGIDQMLNGLAPALPVVGLLAAKLASLGASLPVIGGIFSGITGGAGLLVGAIALVIASSANLRSALGGVFQAVGEIFQTLGSALQPILPLITDLAKQIGDVLADALNFLVPICKDLIENVIRAVAPLLPPIINVLSALIGAIQNIFTALQPVIGFITGLFSSILGYLQPAISGLIPVLNFLADTVSGVGDFLAGLIDTVVSVATTITPIWETLWNTVSTVFSAVWAVISPIFNAWLTVATTVFSGIYEVVSTVWSALWEVVSTVFSAVWAVVSAVFNAWLTVASTVFNTIFTVVSTVWGTLWNTVSTVFSTVWNAVQSLVSSGWETIKNLFTGAWNAVSNIVSNLWNGIKNVFTEGWNTLKNGTSAAIDSVISFFSSMPSKIIGIFANAGSWLWDAGGKIIDGLLGGISRGFQWVKDKLKSLTDLLPSWKGPAEKDKVILKKPAQLIMGGFAKGLEDEFPAIRAKLENFTDTLAPAPAFDPARFSPTSSPAASPADSQSPIYLVLDDGTLVGRLAPKIDKALGGISLRRKLVS